MKRWARELGLGARLAISGERSSWTRLALTAVGVGLGVALLLLAASIPQITAARDERAAARETAQVLAADVRPSARTLLVGFADTSFRGQEIRGRLLRPDGPDAPLPPGVTRLPGPGELVVSPRLAELLRSGDAGLLRERLGGRVVGTIGDAGLAGPGEYAYYAGSDRLQTLPDATRVERFGTPGGGDGLPPILWMLVLIALATLLLPVAVFVGAAMRFGGEQRDRRLAALRLAGADRMMTRRIAAGEALVGALLGVLVGAAVFLIVRQLGERLTLADLSAFAGDVWPSAPLAALIVLAVPALAVAVTLVALRGVAIEPLGVVRRAVPRPRRIWWRVVAPLAGVALLAPLAGGAEQGDEAQVTVGVVLVLLGVAGILPWLVEAVVRRIGAASVSLQLAVRRLQLDSGASARVASGIAVAVAGAIALQAIFGAIEPAQRSATGIDVERVQASVGWELPAGRSGRGDAFAARLAAAPDVRGHVRLTQVGLLGVRDGSEFSPTLTIGTCAALRMQAAIGRCRDGDAFLARPPAGPPADGAATSSAPTGPTEPRAGERLRLGWDGRGRTWAVPRDARVVALRQSLGWASPGVFATPKAAAHAARAARSETFFVRLDRSRPDAIEQLRNAVAANDPLLQVSVLQAVEERDDFTKVRRGIFVGTVAVLVLIGASMLVAALEQLRERRRVLAVLIAFGTPRATLSWSVLWQAAIPVALGLALAVVAGGALGAVLMEVADQPVRLDVAAIAGLAGAGAGVVLLVTALSLPALWRSTRPDGLRTE